MVKQRIVIGRLIATFSVISLAISTGCSPITVSGGDVLDYSKFRNWLQFSALEPLTVEKVQNRLADMFPLGTSSDAVLQAIPPDFFPNGYVDCSKANCPRLILVYSQTGGCELGYVVTFEFIADALSVIDVEWSVSACA